MKPIIITRPLPLHAQVMTADFVPLRVDAVIFYRVVEPSLWVTRVVDGYLATHLLAQTTLRSTLGAHTLADILAQRKGVARRMEVSGSPARHIEGLRKTKTL